MGFLSISAKCILWVSRRERRFYETAHNWYGSYVYFACNLRYTHEIDMKIISNLYTCVFMRWRRVNAGDLKCFVEEPFVVNLFSCGDTCWCDWKVLLFFSAIPCMQIVGNDDDDERKRVKHTKEEDMHTRETEGWKKYFHLVLLQLYG